MQRMQLEPYEDEPRSSIGSDFTRTPGTCRNSLFESESTAMPCSPILATTPSSPRNAMAVDNACKDEPRSSTGSDFTRTPGTCRSSLFDSEPPTTPCSPVLTTAPSSSRNDMAVDDACKVPQTPAADTSLYRRRALAAGLGLTKLRPIALPQDALRQSRQKDPDVFRNYDLKKELGHGKLCTVHLASRPSDSKDVALKVLRTDDAEALKMAETEFRMLRSFNHPNIVGAYDYWVSGGCAVIVLEYFDSVTLDVAVRKNPHGHLGEAQSKSLTSCLLKGIDYLHRNRVVHRDIKPGNVLVSQAHDLKLVDFNAAARVGASLAALSPTGTRSCASPEVLAGEPPSESNDVWAVGCCLFFMLVGAFPQGRERCRSARSLAAAAQQPVDLTGARLEDLTLECKLFLQQCLQIKACARPAPMTLLKHEWWYPDGPPSPWQRQWSRGSQSRDGTNSEYAASSEDEFDLCDSDALSEPPSPPVCKSKSDSYLGVTRAHGPPWRPGTPLNCGQAG